MRRVAWLILLLLASCTSSSQVQPVWITFDSASGMSFQRTIRGTITRGGIVHAEVDPPARGGVSQFERQLRPEDLGRLRQAIDAFRAEWGPDLEVRQGLMDASQISIHVVEGGEDVLSLLLVGPCHEPSDAALVPLWNEIMRAVRSPEYDALDHAIYCR